MSHSDRAKKVTRDQVESVIKMLQDFEKLLVIIGC